MMAPTGFFQQLKSYYTKDADKDRPVILVRTAALLSVAYTLLYVLPFYLSSTTRPSPSLSRDAPSVIRARIRAVTLSTTLSSLSTIYIITNLGSASLLETLRLLGWWPIQPLEIARTLLLTALLFAGPLFEKGVVEGGWRSWMRGRTLHETLSSWIGWRNYVAGPITEEVVFRSLLTPLHLLAHVAPSRIVFLTPLYFGIAHIHHFYEYTLTHPHTPLLPALVRSLVQFAYTTLFGWYATFVFLRTASLPAVVLTHSFCNWCGLPRLWGRVEAGEPIGPPDVRGKDDGEGGAGVGVRGSVQVAGGRVGLGWTVAYYVILVAGVAAFYRGFWVLTESTGAMAQFGGRPK